jgi:hypothetical protein
MPSGKPVDVKKLTPAERKARAKRLAYNRKRYLERKREQGKKGGRSAPKKAVARRESPPKFVVTTPTGDTSPEKLADLARQLQNLYEQQTKVRAEMVALLKAD